MKKRERKKVKKGVLHATKNCKDPTKRPHQRGDVCEATTQVT